jgi:hypothetical protein
MIDNRTCAIWWRIATAWVDGEQPLLAENRNVVRRLSKRA